MNGKSVESYKHKFAKGLLAQWLREMDEYEHFPVQWDSAMRNKLYLLSDLSWRSNRGAPYWGVYEEYPLADPVYDGSGCVLAWDEMKAIDEEVREEEYDWEGIIPSYSELVSKNNPPVCILDVIVLHKGLVHYGFEICHQNPVSERKADILNCLGFPTYEIEAEWILRQVKRPSSLVVHNVFGN